MQLLQREIESLSPAAMHEIARYGIGGAINTLVSFAVYSLLVLMASTPFWLANAAAMIGGVACGFVLARSFVFKNISNSVVLSGWRYIAAIGVQYAVSTVFIGALISAGFGKILSYVIVLPIAVTLSYVLQKKWVFV